jgi:hypothetical protein
MENGEPRCIAFGGLRVDDAIAAEVLRVVQPAAIEAATQAQQQEVHHRDNVRAALTRDLEAARFTADRAFRQYDATDPQNRLVAAELELRWNRAPNVSPTCKSGSMPMIVNDPRRHQPHRTTSCRSLVI